MKNADKIMSALEQAFRGETIRIIEDLPMAEVKVYFGHRIIARFSAFFWDEEYNPEIEIKIKAPLKNIEWFVKDASSFGIIRGAVERGLAEWREESHPNN